MNVACLAEEPNGKPGCSASSDEPVICLVNKQKKFGIVKFIGETEFSSGVWYGVELSEPCGKNDGAVAGKRYFKCAENHGIFVNPNNVHPAKLEYGTRSIVNDKQVKRRVLPNLVHDYYPVASDNFFAENEMSKEVLTTKACSDEMIVTNGNDVETSRPRSKSDNALGKEEIDKGFLFSNNPFKCNIKEGKSSSLPKLDDVTYICHSPIMRAGTDACTKEDVQHPRHSSPLSAFCKNDHPPSATQNACQDSEGSSAEKTSKPGQHMHLKLSPHFEVKQSIKIGSIGRFSLKGQKSGLNKTFLIHKDSLRQERNEMKSNNQKKMVEPQSELQSESKENCKNIKNVEKRGTVSKNQQSSKNVSSTVLSESDGIEIRSRSVSKSSLSSVESFSSAASTKTSNEKSGLKSTGTSKELSNKLPRSSETSKAKSKFVKMSTESKMKAKRTEKIASSTTKGKPSGEKPLTNEKGSINKSRTKSTSVFGSESELASTPAASTKTNMKPISRSVSSDYSARVTSKFSTPSASKISGSIASRRSTTTPLYSIIKSKLNKVSGTESSSRKPPMSVIPRVKRTMSQESNKSENNSTKVIKKKIQDDEKRATKQEDNKVALTKTRNLCTSRAESGNSTNYAGVNTPKSLVLRGNENLSVIAQGLRAPRKVSEKSGERSVVKKKALSEILIKRKPPGNKTTDTRDGNLINCLSSAVTPDILKQIPEVIRQSVGVQVGQDSLEYERFTQSLEDQCKNERDKVESLVSQLSRRNRDFEAILIVLQVYSQKVDAESKNVESLIKCIDMTKKKCLNAEKTIAKENGYRVRLEDEMLSVKSDSVVELVLLKAEYERKQDLMQDQLMEDFKQDLEKARRRHIKTIDEVKRSCDLKLQRVEETYVEDIVHINERHKDDIADLELQHSKDVEELVEERYAEIETIKEDYEEQMEKLKNRLTESHEKCHQLDNKLKITEEESKRDIELRIQDVIAKYKTLPDELESMKFVLEMKNTELKKLRQCNMALRNQIDELQRVKNRAALLEREKESLNYVVENKVQFERQLSLERDKLRRSLDREVAASKRLSLENEELTWRLNSVPNSPTSPTFDRFNWRMSGINSPDNSAVFSHRIEESDLELQMDDMKEMTSKQGHAKTLHIDSALKYNESLGIERILSKQEASN